MLQAQLPFMLLTADLSAAETPRLPKAWAMALAPRNHQPWMFNGVVQIEATPGSIEPPSSVVADTDPGANPIPLVLADGSVIEGKVGKPALVTGGVLRVREDDASNVASMPASK